MKSLTFCQAKPIMGPKWKDSKKRHMVGPDMMKSLTRYQTNRSRVGVQTVIWDMTSGSDMEPLTNC